MFTYQVDRAQFVAPNRNVNFTLFYEIKVKNKVKILYNFIFSKMIKKMLDK